MTAEQKLDAFQRQFEIFSIPLIEQLEEEIGGRDFQYKRHKWDRGFVQAQSFRILCKGEQLRAYLKGTKKPDLCELVCTVRVSRLCRLCGALRISTYVLTRHAVRDYLHWEERHGSTIVYAYNAQRFEFERERRLLRASEPVQVFTCPICLEKYDSESEVDDCVKNHNIKRNFDLAKKLRMLKGNRGRVTSKRLQYAIYRLYRQLDVPPFQIASELKMENSQVQYLIGKVFTAQCLKSDSCVFKKLLIKRK